MARVSDERYFLCIPIAPVFGCSSQHSEEQSEPQHLLVCCVLGGVWACLVHSPVANQDQAQTAIPEVIDRPIVPPSRRVLHDSVILRGYGGRLDPSITR
jgi:hypothetical protein